MHFGHPNVLHPQLFMKKLDLFRMPRPHLTKTASISKSSDYYTFTRFSATVIATEWTFAIVIDWIGTAWPLA